MVDDHPVVREGLVSILNDESDFNVVASAGSAEEALPVARRLRPNIILLDLELAGISGERAIGMFGEAAPLSRVIVFTAYDTDEKIIGALRAGARGYLLKGTSARELSDAIRDVDAGNSHLEPRIAAKVVSQLRADRRIGVLSKREREVLRFIGEGLSNKQIGDRLSIAERTVKFHTRSIMNKLGAGNRAQAVAIAAQRRIL